MKSPTPLDLTQRVAAEVRAEMGRRNLSAIQLAHLSGVPLSTLRRRLRGSSDFDMGELRRVAAALDTDIPELLTRANPAAVA